MPAEATAVRASLTPLDRVRKQLADAKGWARKAITATREAERKAAEALKAAQQKAADAKRLYLAKIAAVKASEKTAREKTAKAKVKADEKAARASTRKPWGHVVTPAGRFPLDKRQATSLKDYITRKVTDTLGTEYTRNVLAIITRVVGVTTLEGKLELRMTTGKVRTLSFRSDASGRFSYTTVKE